MAYCNWSNTPGLPANRKVLYVLTEDDVKELYDQEYGRDTYCRLSPDKAKKVFRAAQKYIESYMGDSSYSWADAIMDSFEVEDE